MTDDRMIASQATEEDVPLENSLRPRRLAEYIGQTQVKENLAIYIEAAKQRSEPLDHVLFHGNPGLGKTSLATVISNELGVNMRSTSGPVIERPGDLAAIFDEPGIRGRALHRRNTPPEPRRGRDPLPGHGRLSDRYHHRAKGRRPGPSSWICPPSPWSARRRGPACFRRPFATGSE